MIKTIKLTMPNNSNQVTMPKPILAMMRTIMHNTTTNSNNTAIHQLQAILTRLIKLLIRQPLILRPNLSLPLMLMVLLILPFSMYQLKQIKQLTRNIGISTTSTMANIQQLNSKPTISSSSIMANMLKHNQIQVFILNKYRDNLTQRRKILLINSLLSEERQVKSLY